MRDARHKAQASYFCATYLARTMTGTSAIPTFAANCGQQPIRVSSACSCLMTEVPALTTQAVGSEPTSA